MNTLLNKIYLVIAGLIMLLIGSYIALSPVEYLASLNNTATAPLPSTNILSDLRGMGDMLILLGSFVVYSSFRKPWLEPALLIATLVYAAFVIFRSVGLVIDGLPDFELLIAYLIEWIMVLAGTLLLNYYPVGSDHRVLKID